MQNPLLGKQIDYMRYVKLLWKWKWLIVLPAVLFPAAAGYYAMQLPDSFKSSTLILVTPQKVPTNFVASTVTTGITDRLNTISQQIFSRTRLEQIIQEFNLFKDMREDRTPEEIIETMRGRIQLNVSRSNSFTLSFIDANPRLAMLVTNKLASLFIEENLKVREQQAIGTSQFLQDEIDRYREQIRGLEKGIQEYKQKYMKELPEQLASNQSKLNQLQNQLQINTQNINAAEDRRVRLQQQMAEMERRAEENIVSRGAGSGLSISDQLAALFESGAGGAGPAVDDSGVRALEAEIDKREKIIEGMLLTLTEKHPDVIRMRSEIAKLQEKVDAEQEKLAAERERLAAEQEAQAEEATPAEVPVEAGPQFPPAYYAVKQDLLRAEVDIAKLTAHNEEIQKAIELYQRRVAATPARQLQLQQISEDYDNVKAVLENLINKKLQADLSENLERKQKGEQFKILDPANLPEKPFLPNRGRFVMGGLGAGLALGIGFILLLDLLDFSVRSKDELDDILPAPVLTVIPEIRTAASIRRRFLVRVSIFSCCVACLLVAVLIFHIKVKPFPDAVADLAAQVRATHWTTIR